MYKQSVDWPTVGRYATGGLVTGAGTAALLNLMRYIHEMYREKKEQEVPAETSENTIVVNLPRKVAEINPSKTTTMTKTLTGLGKPAMQPRRHSGQLGPSTVSNTNSAMKLAAGWPTLTLSAVAALGGGTLGAMLVNKIYQNRRMSQLEDELNATQQQYLSSLPMKGAEFLGGMFDLPAKMADSDGSVFGFVNYPLATMALLGLLGTGGSAYITKRVLDEKLRAASEEGLELPKVKRIVFRSQPGTEPAKQASAEDIECVKAAVGVMLDRLDSTTKVLNMPYVKLAMDKANTSAMMLMKEASDIDTLMAHLQSNPELRKMIIRAGMESHPMLKHFKWAYGLPGVQGMADKALYGRVGQALNPQMQNSARAIGGSEGHTNMAEARAEGSEKQADLAGSALAGMVGSAISGQNARKELVSALAEAEKSIETERQRKKRLPPAETAAQVQLEAKDPAAQAYLDANKQKVMKVLQGLAAAGKI